MTDSLPDPRLAQVAATRSLGELYPVLDALRMTPGWHKKRPSLWKQPRTEFQPLHWRYDLGRLALEQAGQWIGTELAERRNFLLFNPVGDNDYDTVRTLVVAFQMIKPGEHARAHRHSPNAMRLVLDAGPGCFTVVDGVKLPMHTGDFLLTPGGCWHSHFNEGTSDAFWIDILDVPLVHLLEPMFFEEHPDGHQAVDQAPATHPFYMPAAQMDAALAASADQGGVRRSALAMEPAIPTVAASPLAIAAGATFAPPRSTANRLLLVTRGTGTARLGDASFTWARGDVMAVPAWTPFALTASTDAMLVEVNDEPVMRKLGFYREA